MRALILAALLGADGGVLLDPFADLPEVVQAVPIAGQLESMKVPVLARAVHTKLTPQLAQRWVVGSFRRHHLYIPPGDRQFQIQGAPSVTGYDPVNFRTYTAIFKENADGSTTLVLGTADVSKDDWRQATASLPVFPAAQQVLESQLEGARSVAYTVKATEAEVVSFYGDVLGAAGWARNDDGWKKDARQLVVQQTPIDQGRRRVVVLERPVGQK